VPFDNLRKRIHLARGLNDRFSRGCAEDFFEPGSVIERAGPAGPATARFARSASAWLPGATRRRDDCSRVPNIPPNHGTVLVEYDTGLFVVDASMLHSEPLRLDEQAETVIEHPAWGVRAGKRDGHWYIRWRR